MVVKDSQSFQTGKGYFVGMQSVVGEGQSGVQSITKVLAGVITGDYVLGKFLKTVEAMCEVTELGFGSVDEDTSPRAEGDIVGKNSGQGMEETVPAHAGHSEHRIVPELR